MYRVLTTKNTTVFFEDITSDFNTALIWALSANDIASKGAITVINEVETGEVMEVFYKQEGSND